MTRAVGGLLRYQLRYPLVARGAHAVSQYLASVLRTPDDVVLAGIDNIAIALVWNICSHSEDDTTTDHLMQIGGASIEERGRPAPAGRAALLPIPEGRGNRAEILVYDERDTLEAWIPELDVGPEHDREPGPYEMFSNARLKGGGSALDWLIVNSFSYAYSEIMAEVRSKEPSVPDRYNVPEFGLYDVPLSTVLEHVYQTHVLKQPAPVSEATVEFRI